MENNARASNIQYRPSSIPREPARKAAAVRQPSPEEKSETKSFQAAGLGLKISAPKCPASFVVESLTAERHKLKACFDQPRPSSLPNL